MNDKSVKKKKTYPGPFYNFLSQFSFVAFITFVDNTYIPWRRILWMDILITCNGVFVNESTFMGDTL